MYSLAKYSVNSCKVLEELFELWIKSDTLAGHIAFQEKGFQYLFNIMGIEQLQKSSKEIEDNNIANDSVLTDTDLMSYVSFLKEDKFEKNASISLNKALKDNAEE